MSQGKGESQQHDNLKQSMGEPRSLSCSSESCQYPCEQCTGPPRSCGGVAGVEGGHTGIWIDVRDSQGGALC